MPTHGWAVLPASCARLANSDEMFSAKALFWTHGTEKVTRWPTTKALWLRTSAKRNANFRPFSVWITPCLSRSRLLIVPFTAFNPSQFRLRLGRTTTIWLPTGTIIDFRAARFGPERPRGVGSQFFCSHSDKHFLSFTWWTKLIAVPSFASNWKGPGGPRKPNPGRRIRPRKPRYQ